MSAWVDAATEDDQAQDEKSTDEPEPEPTAQDLASANSTIILSSDAETIEPAPVPKQSVSSIEVDEHQATMILPEAFEHDLEAEQEIPTPTERAPIGAAVARISTQKQSRRKSDPSARQRPGGGISRAEAARTRLGERAKKRDHPRRGRTGTEPLKQRPKQAAPETAIKKKGILVALLAFVTGLGLAAIAGYFLIIKPDKP